MPIDDFHWSNRSQRDPSPWAGLPSIDQEHHELVMKLEALIDSVDAHPDAIRFSAILGDLAHALAAHFSSEEAVMASLNMPAATISAHARAHREILDQCARLTLDLERGKIFSRSKVALMIKGWIVDHFVHYDLAIEKYIPTGSATDLQEKRPAP